MTALERGQSRASFSTISRPHSSHRQNQRAPRLGAKPRADAIIAVVALALGDRDKHALCDSARFVKLGLRTE